MKILILLALTTLQMTASADCYQYLGENTISWTAFKTPAKAGVGGEFKEFKITPAKNKASIEEILVGSSFDINTSSVHTKNKARDKKIVDNFFKDVTIKGKISKIKKGNIIVDFLIGKTKKSIPLKYEVKDNTLHAKGTIDVFDFMLHDNLKAINKACYALHEGKTWNDVNISLTSKLGACK